MKTNDTAEPSENKARVAYQTPQRIEGEEGLYWRGGQIYCRVRVDGKQTFRTTGTDKLPKARKVLAKWREDEVMRQHGIEPRAAAMERNRLSVAEVLREYKEEGFPDRKNRTKKTASTLKTETGHLLRLQAFFGARAAASLTLKDCDSFRRWRASGGYTWQAGEKTRKSKAGDRIVDLELQTFGNALALAVRQEKLKADPLAGRIRYHSEEDCCHAKDRAATVEQLQLITSKFRQKGEDVLADCVMFLGLSGLRVNEALPLSWEDVAWSQGVVHVRREKNGCNPFVPITAELGDLLRKMRERSKSFLLFPSADNPQRPLPYSTIATKFRKLTVKMELPRLCLHGLRSFFATSARESGLSDWVVGGLLGHRSGGILITRAYGQTREDHLQKQAQLVRFMIEAPQKNDAQPSTQAAAA
ncbi:MAG: tyrosine-type recombinase/integrase [Verrucomicrobia bacterium]|nr:tyrosine-type recombinase/integrase [Verrucomicrobiota bacterium]